jgi:glutamate/tyrosine decarboxylase-like PLP-dependent enzyme
MRKIEADGDFRLPLEPLRAAIAADRAAGLVPFCVVANAGTTNTGAVDPLSELADLCGDEGLWLHADGAYGAASCVSARGRLELAGLGRVDSLSLDPHKWLFQPIETGCVLVRDRRLLRDTYAIHPEYLQDVHRDQEAVNFCDYGIQLTRGFRALKVWMSLQVFGLDHFAAAVERGFELAERAEGMLREEPVWRVVTPARMAIVCFRYEVPGKSEEELDRLQVGIVEALKAGGYAVVTSTRLFGQTVLRFCTINPRTTEEDLRRTLAEMTRLGGELAGGVS